MTFGIFAPHLRKEFGWSLGQISLGATILSIMIVIIAPVQGWLIDRFGARRIILTCIPLFGLGFTLMALYTGDLWQLYLAWAVLPVLGVGLWPASYAKATSGWFTKRLGMAIAVATIGIGIGAAVLPIVIGQIVQLAGWRIAYVFIGVFSVTLAWPAAGLLVRDAPQTAAERTAVRAESVGDEFRSPNFWILGGAFVCLGFFSVAMLVHLVSILQQGGLSLKTAVAAQSLAGVTTVLGRLLSGWLLDRVTVRVVLPVFAVGSAIGVGLLAFATPSVFVAFLSAALMGALIGAEIDVLGFVVKRYFGLARYGLLYGGLFSVFQLGGAVGVFFLGSSGDKTSGFASGLTVVMGTCIAAGLLFTLLRSDRLPSKAPR
jgi:MFS family permease